MWYGWGRSIPTESTLELNLGWQFPLAHCWCMVALKSECVVLLPNLDLMLAYLLADVIINIANNACVDIDS